MTKYVNYFNILWQMLFYIGEKVQETISAQSQFLLNFYVIKLSNDSSSTE